MRATETILIADAANKDEIDIRVAQIKKELSETDSIYDTEKLSERIAKLAGGVAVIKVRAHAVCILVASPKFEQESRIDKMGFTIVKALNGQRYYNGLLRRKEPCYGGFHSIGHDYRARGNKMWKLNTAHESEHVGFPGITVLVTMNER